MTKDEQIAYWVEESDRDKAVMHSLLESRHYTWALFVGHLVLEKLLKALYVKNADLQVPRIHNLLKIARSCGLQMSDEQEEFLLEVTTYNLKTRYPDYKKSFQRQANEEFTLGRVSRIEEMQEWLKKIIAG
jgi:HEPN domain-containing protein